MKIGKSFSAMIGKPLSTMSEMDDTTITIILYSQSIFPVNEVAVDLWSNTIAME